MIVNAGSLNKCENSDLDFQPNMTNMLGSLEGSKGLDTLQGSLLQPSLGGFPNQNSLGDPGIINIVDNTGEVLIKRQRSKKKNRVSNESGGDAVLSGDFGSKETNITTMTLSPFLV